MATPVDRDRFAQVVEAFEAFKGWSGAWAGELELVVDYLTRLPTHDEFAYLPELFSGGHRLPLADMYVELRVSKGSLIPLPHLLSDRVVDDWVEERRRIREKGRMSVEEALDRSPHRRFVILGDPGGGKSSLLRRIARDIAEQKWKKWCIPLHVSLPRYWQCRKSGMPFINNIFDYIYAGTHIRRISTLSIRGDIGSIDSSSCGGFVFIFDGLDEISSDKLAWRDVVSNLKTLRSYNLSWIVASRRTGLFQDLGEDIRYDILDLDRDGVEQLVGNWFQSLPDERGPDPASASARMVDELAAEPRLLSMARNPYLCMLLCYLRAQSDNPLPTNRATVYQAIIDAARRQLRSQTDDETVFSLRDLNRLGALCHDLYRGTPRHLFSSDDWERLFDEPLTRRSVFLQSRLVDKWGDSESNYHLTHLTLHEYLIAWHLAQAGFERDVAEHLHAPPWRMVWRFLASRLWADGRRDEAVGLVRRLLEEIDLLGLVYVEAAHLLAEMDSRAALTMLGTDLRQHLWDLWARNEPNLAEAAGAALAILDPEFCLRRLREAIASPLCDRDQDGGAQLYRLARHGAPIEVVPAIRAIALLGDIKRREAVEFLLELFSDTKNGRLGDRAAETLATIDDRRLRRRIMDIVDQADDEWIWRRFVDLAGQSRHPDYLPRLIEAVGSAERDDLYRLCQALCRYGSPQAFPALKERRENGGLREKEDIPVLAQTLVECLGPDGHAWLDEQLGYEVTEANGTLWYCAVEEGVFNPGRLASILTTSPISTAVNLIEALGDFADQGGEVATGVWGVLRSFFELEEENDRAIAFSALVKIAVARISLLRELDLAPFVGVARNLDHPQRAEAARVVVRFKHPAVNDMLRAAFDPTEDAALRVSVITSFMESNQVLVGTELLSSFIALLDDREAQVAEAAADAIAYSNLQLLVPHQHKRPARMALARHCAERGILVFRDRIVGAR